MTTMTLAVKHAKYSLLETARTPIAIISALAFPSLGLLFFVVPQQEVASNPLWATQAVIGMSVFAIMSNSLFSFGLTISEDREKPWDPYLRTLPVRGISRVLAYVFSIGLIGFAAILPQRRRACSAYCWASSRSRCRRCRSCSSA